MLSYIAFGGEVGALSVISSDTRITMRYFVLAVMKIKPIARGLCYCEFEYRCRQGSRRSLADIILTVDFYDIFLFV